MKIIFAGSIGRFPVGGHAWVDLQYLHGLQTWVALPREREETEPRFEHYSSDAIPSVERDGASIRVVIGEVQVGRYTSVRAAPTEAQANLLSTLVTVAFPSHVSTVGEAVRHLLSGSGYRLAAET